MDRPPRSQVLRYLALALALALPLPAAGATFSNVSITLDPANSLDFSDDSAPERGVNLSSASVLASGSSSFSTRYAAVVGADIGGLGANDLTRSLTASFTISFEVTAGAGGMWDVILDFGRTGAMTVVSDGNGDATVALGALSGTQAGAGALSAGSLGLGALSAGNTANQGQSPNVAFAQTGSATISGVGTGSAQLVSISFSFTASATSNDRPGGATPEGDEAALRLGLTSALSGFGADDYPGAGGRDPNGDGFMLTATLVPEPDTAVLISLGLGGLAVMGSDRRLRRLV